jgi:hypothetical protein
MTGTPITNWKTPGISVTVIVQNAAKISKQLLIWENDT